MARDLRGAAVVVTGASSGIGRATALRFARAGARVALAARGGAALREVEGEITALGAEALSVECDVTDEEAVEALARRAEERFGRIDVWVNDAGVYEMGRFEDLPDEVFRRVLDVNFFGVVNGARAALRRFRRQGTGTLVNVASIDGKVPAPYGSAYAASKHAVVAFSGALRQELLLDGARGVHVCTVLPATIDTPLFQHGANYTGYQVKALPPVYAPGRVARVIVDLARRPRREALVGTSAHVFAALFKVAPGLVERFFARTVHRQHLRHRHASADTPGNAFATQGPHGESGGWMRPPSRRRRAAAFGVPVALAAGALWARARAG
jgi:NAD(P)-dependent dehydrogenase (short-subunit alcohol dehydrogenase family)